MFKKNNKIVFTVDDNNDLYIEISENPKDNQSAAKLANLISLLETGNLHNQLISAIRDYANQNKRTHVGNYIVENINQSLNLHNDQIYQKYVENKISNIRDPIITPDIVLKAFNSSLHA